MPTILVSLALLLGLTAVGEDPPPAPAVVDEQVAVSEVLLDVVVTDRNGVAVLGLGPRDFQVALAGRDVAPLAATFYSNRRFVGEPDVARAARVDPADPGEGRLFVLFFDDQRRVFGSRFSFVGQQLEAGRRAAEWIATGLAPGDRAAVVAFDSRLRLYQDFTEDRDLLRRAVLAAAAGGPAPDDWPSRRPSGDGSPSLAAALPTGTELRDRSPRIYEALQLTADALAPVRGRKNLILFSRGFGELGAFGRYRRDVRYYPPTRDALNAANVAVYGINTGPQDGLEALEGLSELSSDTGGELYRLFVTFTTPLEQVAAVTNGYYLVAVPAPDDATPGDYLETEVRCRNPELSCVGRRGFRAAGQ